MPHFGPAVIGEQAFKKQKESEGGGKQHFGPAVLDPHHAHSEAKKRAEALKPPPAVTPGEIAPAPPVAAPTEESFSVRDVKQILQDGDSTAALDRVMLAEFTRPDGARKSALDVMHKWESRQKNPRAEVLDALDSKLEEIGG